MPYDSQEKKREAARRRYRESPARRKTIRDSVFKRKERIKAWIESMKEGVPCADCGCIFPPKAMDWHHERGRKEFALADAPCKGYSEARILAEIKECVVLGGARHRRRD